LAAAGFRKPALQLPYNGNVHNGECIVSAERQVAGADVGVEREFTGAGFLEGAKEAGVGFAEGGAVDIARSHGSFDVGVVAGIADADGEIAGMEFDVLTANVIFNGDIACGDAGVKLGIARDVDFDFEVIVRTAADMEFGVAAGAGETVAKVVNVVLVFAGDVHGKFSVFGAEDADVARAEMEGDTRSGGDLGLKVRNAAFGDFGFVGACGDGKSNEGQGTKGREERLEERTIHRHLA